MDSSNLKIGRQLKILIAGSKANRERGQSLVFVSILTHFQAGQKGLGARRAKADERRRTRLVCRSESGKRNEADEPFSPA